MFTSTRKEGAKGLIRRRRGFAAEGFELEPRLLAAVDVLTYHNDNARTGQNLAETILTPAAVGSSAFGKLGQVAVDGQVYAQPLVKTGVAIPGQGVHNVVYVATEHDSVYAFDADTLALLWHDSFINPAAGVTTVSSKDVNTTDLYPEVGVTSTPVIDPATGAIYVVSDVKTTSAAGKAVYLQQIHALDLATGAEKFGGPVNISASVRGKGAGSVRGLSTFDPHIENQRAALLLSNGTVYITWASFGDNGPYHGWVIGYDAGTLRRNSAFNLTPNGSRGGVWMSGGGLAADAAGSIYLASGNGTFRVNRLKGDFGDSVLKLNPGAGKLAVADYFTPGNQAKLQAKDLDLGSGGVLLVPDQTGAHPHLLVTAGKEGTIYVIDRDRMGKYSRLDKTVATLPKALPSSFDTPAYFNGKIYYVGTGERTTPGGGGGDSLKAFTLNNGVINPTPAVAAGTFGYPGASPSVSANGAAGGVVWALDNGASATRGPAILRAYEAGDVTKTLYNSSLAGRGGQSGAAVKFAVPTVANGKVYVGGNGALTLYGLRTSST